MKIPSYFIGSLLFLAICAIAVGVFAPSSLGADRTTDQIPGRYIVVFNNTVQNPQDVVNEMAKIHGLAVEHVYTSALKGFAAFIPPARLEKLQRDSQVQFISADYNVQTLAQTMPTGISRVQAPLNTTNKGAGIGVAVIDTGIDLTHPDLKANIVASKSCIKGRKNANDDNGHGSHVAGTIAALDNGVGVVGVAPQARLVAVKVLNSSGSGTWSSVICGIDWVTSHAAQYNIKVANMSLGGGGSSDNNCGNSNNDALHKAICNSTSVGVTYVVAAGNSSANAISSVPAAYDDTVITVSALADSDGQSGGSGPATAYGADDTFASFSNYGNIIDIAAPGVAIYSTWKTGGYSTINGTSMATPHVAGGVALYIKSHPGVVWSQVRDGLRAAAEQINNGHTDLSGVHPEPVLQASAL